MNTLHAVKLFIRSNTHIALAAVSLVGAVVLGFITAGILAPIFVIIGYVGTSTILFFSRLGAKEIVREQEEIFDEGAMREIEVTATLRRRLSVLRIDDPEVAKAIGRISLISGRLIEEEQAQKKYVPQVKGALEEATGVCTAYLDELDAESTSRRYRVRTRGIDGEQAEMSEAGSPANRAVKLLGGIADRLEEIGASELPGVKASSDFDVIEEMNDT